MEKSPDAFRTISEVADDLDLPQHVLRFWEGRFPQIRPLKRAGGRRYYRPADVSLLRTIRQLLYDEGYTIKGVQRLLKDQAARAPRLAGPASHMPSCEPPSCEPPSCEPPICEPPICEPSLLAAASVSAGGEAGSCGTAAFAVADGAASTVSAFADIFGLGAGGETAMPGGAELHARYDGTASAQPSQGRGDAHEGEPVRRFSAADRAVLLDALATIEDCERILEALRRPGERGR